MGTVGNLSCPAMGHGMTHTKLATQETVGQKAREVLSSWLPSSSPSSSYPAASFLLLSTHSWCKASTVALRLQTGEVGSKLEVASLGPRPLTRFGATGHHPLGLATQPVFLPLHCSSAHAVFGFFQSSGTSPIWRVLRGRNESPKI